MARGIGALLVLGIAACGGESFTETISPPVEVTVPADTFVDGIEYVAGQPRIDLFHIELPNQLQTFTSITADLAAAMESLEITRTDGGNSADPTLLVRIRIALDDVGMEACNGIPVTPEFAVIGDEQFVPQMITAGQVSAPEAVFEILNSGSATLCIMSESSVNATITLGSLPATIGMSAACQEPQMVQGFWKDEYECTNSCGEDFSGTTQIKIDQSGHNVFFTDSGAFYVGKLCGKRYDFAGMGDGFVETGSIQWSDLNTATKRTDWSNTVDECTGTCETLVSN